MSEVQEKTSIVYNLTPQVTVTTDVSGSAFNLATVTIKDGSMTVWSGTMMQTSPSVNTPANLKLGTMTMDEGKFSLTIPTNIQNGQVVLDATTSSAGNPPAPLNATVAQWNDQGEPVG